MLGLATDSVSTEAGSLPGLRMGPERPEKKAPKTCGTGETVPTVLLLRVNHYIRMGIHTVPVEYFIDLGHVVAR